MDSLDELRTSHVTGAVAAEKDNESARSAANLLNLTSYAAKTIADVMDFLV